MPSTWVTTNELTNMRTAVLDLFPQTCVLSTLTEISDGQGGMTQSWVAAGTTDCRLAAQSGNVRAIATQLEATGAFPITLPFDTVVTVGQRATIDTLNYRVTFVDKAKTWRAAIVCSADLETT